MKDILRIGVENGRLKVEGQLNNLPLLLNALSDFFKLLAKIEKDRENLIKKVEPTIKLN